MATFELTEAHLGFMATKPVKDETKNTVKSLAKGFAILQAFTARDTELLLSEVARRACVDNATAFRFLNTLTNLGYVEKVADTKRFRLTFKCLDLGFNAIARSDLRTLARPYLKALLGEYAEAASIGVLDGASVIYIERMQAGITRLGVDIRVGMRIPAYCSALGQAMLAHVPGHYQTKILESIERTKLTDSTLTSLAALKRRLVDVRALGYAVSDQETVAGLRAIAAPILGSEGLSIAAISVAGASNKIALEKFVEVYARRLTRSAETISRAIQASGQTSASPP